jgi:hypothetical protein
MTMSEAIKTEQYNGHEIKIVYDNDPMDPRKDCEPQTEFHVMNSRYYMGEHQHQNATEIDKVVRQAQRQGDLVFRLFAYVHSGTYLSLRSWYGRLPQGHAEFDSGQCGVVIVRRKSFVAEWGNKKWTKKLREKAEEVAKQEVETFTSYLNGSVYGYIIDDGEDSCFGYYDDDEAMVDAKRAVDFEVKREAAEKEEVVTMDETRDTES